MPVEDAVVLARNESTGAETRTTTTRNGAYAFSGLDAGAYTVEAQSEQLGRGRLEGVLISAGHETRIQTAMEFELTPPMPILLVFHEIALVPLTLDAPLPAQPLLQPQLNGRMLPRWIRDIPLTFVPVTTAALDEQQLLALPLPGRMFPRWLRDIPVAAVPITTAALAEEPLLIPSLPARPLATFTPGAAPATLPTSSAANAVALQPATPLPPSPIQMARQEIDPVTPAVTTTLSGAELQALPASSRRWQNFVLDTPTASTAAGGAAQTSLRGAGQEPPETAVDGMSTRMAFGGRGGSNSNEQGETGENGMSQAWTGARGSPVAEAAIREVQTVAGNAEAEGTRTAGGRTNVETERGGNGLHGQGFFFDRQNTWGAQNPFTQWVKETAPATLTTSPAFTPEPYTPPDREAVWGVGLGSQIRRDKLFWFAALDSYQRNDPGLATVKHPDEFFAQPSNDQMQALSARLGLNGNNGVADALKDYSSMLETLNGLLGPAPRTASQWVGFGRLDWDAAERDRFTLEGIGARWDSPGGGLTRISETYGSHSFGSSQAAEQWLMGRWEAFITPNLLAVTQGSVGHNNLSVHAEAPSAFEQTFLGPNVYGQLPQIAVDNRYGFTIGNPSRFGQGNYPDEHITQAQEIVDWVKGSLLVKTGFELSHNSDSTSFLRNQTGSYSYSNVENFASDALAFATYGFSGELNTANQHTCDETGKVWRDSSGGLRGLGALPCYAYYSQSMGPTDWHLSTNDWAGYTTAQWQANRLLVISSGLRWEREQLPPPIAALWPPPALPNSPTGTLPFQSLPSLGNNWGPRLSVALGNPETHWPVLRVGYGMYFGRTENATVETALTQTGSLHGDLSFFVRPTEGYNSATGASNAAPFPYVFQGDPLTVVKPGAVEFAPNFRNPEVHQAVAAVEESLPGHVVATASAIMSLGRRLPTSVDTNFDPLVNPGTITYAVADGTGLGPIKTPQINVPFYASLPFADCPSGTPLNLAGECGRFNTSYQQITEVMSRANSTYEAAMLKVVRYGRRGLSLHAHYIYAHAMDWNPNESTQVAGSDVLDPANFSQEYGTSNLDVRHSAAAMVIYEPPWKLNGVAKRIGNGWMLSAVAQFRSGLPYTMRTSGSLAEEFNAGGSAVVGLGPGMNGSGGDNRVYGVGRNTYRYPATWKADMRLGKSFDLGAQRKLELLLESFNLFNHQNVTELETTGYYLESGTSSGALPTLNFLTGLKANTTAFGQPLNVNATDFYRERQFQLGVKMRF
jgi:hypothetical protein